MSGSRLIAFFIMLFVFLSFYMVIGYVEDILVPTMNWYFQHYSISEDAVQGIMIMQTLIKYVMPPVAGIAFGLNYWIGSASDSGGEI
jgi:hypothetical protein